MKTTVVIPAYNERDTIEKTVSGIRELGPEYQVRVVDGGSCDGTAAPVPGRQEWESIVPLKPNKLRTLLFITGS